MLADLERLIQLQRLDDFVTGARQTLAEHPDRLAALDSRLAGARDRLAGSRAGLAKNQACRRALEKDLATIQGRLARFKDQLMEVKTNREYQAMLKEIETAEREIRALEDRMLERMLEADELAGAVRQAEEDLAVEQASIDSDRGEMEGRALELEAELARAVPARETLVAAIAVPLCALYDHVARNRKGVAVAEARDGHCTVCHVRLRPQVYNEIRRNETIVQCDSCQRILYFAAGAAAGGSAPR